MFYTPNFCCECGDKIERDNWKLTTSRKFCENCETEYKFQKWIPASALAAGVIGIVFSFGSYLKTPEKSANLLAKTSAAQASNKNQDSTNQSDKQNSASANVQTITQKAETGNNAAPPRPSLATATPSALKQNASPGGQDSAQEAIYICGAQTKKGTACLRRVKGGGRCWQHTGQPAILPPDKLIIRH